MMNEGGYFSFTSYSGKNENNVSESQEKHVNFDLNNNKIMSLEDLFIDDFDYKTKIFDLLKNNQNYRLSKDTFAEDEEILISESDFNFNQDAVLVILYQPGVYVREQYLFFEFKDIGYENISIFQ